MSAMVGRNRNRCIMDAAAINPDFCRQLWIAAVPLAKQQASAMTISHYPSPWMAAAAAINPELCRQVWIAAVPLAKQQRQLQASVQLAMMRVYACACAYFSAVSLHWNQHFMAAWTTSAMTQFLLHKRKEVNNFFHKHGVGRSCLGLNVCTFVELVNKHMPLLSSAKEMIFDLINHPTEHVDQYPVVCILNNYNPQRNAKEIGLDLQEFEKLRPWLSISTPTYRILWCKTRCYLRLHGCYHPSSRHSFDDLPELWKERVKDAKDGNDYEVIRAGESDQLHKWFVTSYTEIETFVCFQLKDADADGQNALNGSLNLEFHQTLVPKRKYYVEYQQPLRPQTTLKKEVDGAASSLSLTSPWFNSEAHDQRSQAQEVRKYWIQRAEAKRNNPLKQHVIYISDSLVSYFHLEPYLEEIVPSASSASASLMSEAIFVHQFTLTEKECRLFKTVKLLERNRILAISCNVGNYRVSLCGLDDQKQVIIEQLQHTEQPTKSRISATDASPTIIDDANDVASPVYVVGERGDMLFTSEDRINTFVYFNNNGEARYLNPITGYENDDEGLFEPCTVPYDAANEQSWLITLATILEKACDRFGIPKMPVQFETDNFQIRCDTSEGYHRVSSITQSPWSAGSAKPDTAKIDVLPTKLNGGMTGTSTTGGTSSSSSSSSERITTYVVTTGGKKILEFNLKKDGIPKIIMGIRGETLTEDGRLMGSKGAVMMTKEQIAEYREEAKKKMNKKQLEAQVKLEEDEKLKRKKKTDDAETSESKQEKKQKEPELPTPALVLLELQNPKSIFSSKSKIAQSRPMQFAGDDHFCKFRTDKSDVDKVYPLKTFYKCATKSCNRIGLWGACEPEPLPKPDLGKSTLPTSSVGSVAPKSTFSFSNLLSPAVVKESEPTWKTPLLPKTSMKTSKDVEMKLVASALPTSMDGGEGKEEKKTDEGKEEKVDNSSSAPSESSSWVPLFCVGCSSKLKNARLMDIEVYVDKKHVARQESADKFAKLGKLDGLPIIAMSPIAKKPIWYFPGAQVLAEGKFNTEATGCDSPGVFFFCERDRTYDYVFHSYPRILQPGFTE